MLILDLILLNADTDVSTHPRDEYLHVIVNDVELSFVLLQNANQVQLLVHVCEVDRLVNE